MDQGAIIAMAVGLVIALLINFGPRMLDALGAPRRRREGQEFTRRAAGGRPPMSAADVEELERWLAGETLPYAGLVIGDAPPKTDHASCLGGPAWLPEGLDWPIDGDGSPLNLLVQINFAEAPPLADFPDHGLLLIFVGDEDVYGLTWKEPEQSNIKVLYVADPSVPGRLVARPPTPPPTHSPFLKHDVEGQGRSIGFVAGSMARTSKDWRIDHKWPGWWARGGDPDFADLLDRRADSASPDIYIGGHPYFIDRDIREPGRFEDYDRVLLQANTDDANTIMWGDAGGATFMIRRADLLARNFSRVLFTWDSC